MEEISSRKNPLIAHVKKLGADKKYRREEGEYFCQGDKLLYEAVKWDAKIKTVLFCGDPPDVPECERMVRVPKDIIESISPMKSRSWHTRFAGVSTLPRWRLQCNA